MSEIATSSVAIAADGSTAPASGGPALCPWPLSIATYNIHGARGTDGRVWPERIVEVITEIAADVIALQEVPMGGSRNVLEIIERETGFTAAAGATCSRGECNYGNAVLSRYPMQAIRTVDLSFGQREPRGALDTDLDCHGQPLRIVATHLGLSLAERRHQVQRLLEVFDTAEMAVILLGDLNEWFVWGQSLRWLKSHFQKSHAVATFPSWAPVLALDRIWIRPYQRLVHVKAHKSKLARVASDHLPLMAHIGEGIVADAPMGQSGGAPVAPPSW